MNILFLCSAGSWGGNEKWTLAAAAGLAERGHRVRLGVNSSIFEEKGAGLPLEIVRYPMAGKYDFASVRKIRRDLRALDVDMLIPTKQREYFLGGLAAWGVSKTKVVARLGIDRPIRGWRNRLAFHRFFDGVIVNSRSIVDVLARSRGFDASICQVIHNGITLPELRRENRERVRRELSIPDSAFVIAGVGRLTAQKGFDQAIEAFAPVAADLPQARLLVVGEGSDRSTLESQCSALGIRDRVTFAGFRDDVSAVLQAVDLFWLTSRSEGMPNALLEAMASQTACCAFDVAGVRELIPESSAGLVVPSGDVPALVAATLELAADDSRRAALATAARRRVQEAFSPEEMVNATEGFLAKVLAKAG